MARCEKCANLDPQEVDDGVWTHECPVADVLPFKGRCREFVRLPKK